MISDLLEENQYLRKQVAELEQKVEIERNSRIALVNKIAELEKENKTVTRKANEAIADKLLITAKYNEILNDLNQENDKLQKENAELKEKKIKGCYFGKDELGNDFFAKCDCVDCQKRTIALLDLRKEYLNKINKEKATNEQLTKAKDILRRLMASQPTPSSMYEEADLVVWREVNKEAEQFLNSYVEK